MTNLQQIQPSPQLLLILCHEDREVRLLDVKTMALLSPTLKDDSFIGFPAIYCQPTEQVIGSQTIKTILNVWNTDQETVSFKANISEKISCLCVDPSQTMIVGGSETGSIFIWQIPSGLLLRRFIGHSKKVISAVVDQQLTIISASQSQVKSWSLWNVLGTTEKEVRFSNLLNMKDKLLNLKIHGRKLCILTDSACLLYHSSNFEKQNTFVVPFPQCFECTPYSELLYVGSANHDIYQFKTNRTVEYKQVQVDQKGIVIDKTSKERILRGHKTPVNSISWLNSLKLLVSGSQNGQIIVWSSGQVKKQITLKGCIIQLLAIPRPSNHKANQLQKHKICVPRMKQLLKYEQGKLNQPLQVPSITLSDSIPPPQNPKSVFLSIVKELCDEKGQMQNTINQLKQQNEHLIRSNNHYAKLFLEKFD